MKRIISFVIASAAVAMALVSCTKEIIVNKEAEKGINTDGTRTLTISFATKATKTDLLPDRITPVWKEGDQISLNGTPYNVPAADVGTTSCTITTDIQGAITAVYPATAYQSAEPYFKVSDEQDGSFGCANICVAEAASGESLLLFENVTAVFEVTVPEGTTKLTVTSLGKIDSETGRRGTAAEDKAAINTTGEGDAAKVITVEKSDKSAFEEDFVYVAVAVDPENGVLLADLNFDTGSAQGGVSPNYIKSKGQEPMTYKATAGTIYTPVLHEYVVADGKKWATMNVGATSPTDYGDYFMWGETSGQKPSDSKFDPGFSWTTYHSRTVFTSAVYATSSSDAKKVFKKYVPSAQASTFGDKGTYSDDKNTLDLEDDAAFWNWGGAWRMPKEVDFNNLLDNTSTTRSNFDATSGVLTINGTSLKFPAAGYGNKTEHTNAGIVCRYWSSSLNIDNPYEARFLTSGTDVTRTDGSDRCIGRSVRPISN